MAIDYVGTLWAHPRTKAQGMNKKHDRTQSVSGRKCNPRQHKASIDKADKAHPNLPKRPADPWSDPWDAGPLAEASKQLWNAFVSDMDDDHLLPNRRELDDGVAPQSS